MYNHLNNYERALRTFGIQVEIICAQEMGGTITPERAHERVREEYKKLKKIRKSES